MARVELLSAMAFDQQTYEASGVADPAIRVLGELPATARPFGLHRVYRGPQGAYEEAILLLDPDDVVVWERPYRVVELRGEMFEDRFLDQVRADVKIDSPGEHTLVFLIGGVEVGRVPVFIDAPDSIRSSGVVDEAIAAAFKKGALLWLTIPQPDGTRVHRPAWYVWDGGKLHVLTGPDEQDLPHLADCDEVEVHVKAKDVKVLIATVPATVEVVPNDSDEFDRIAQLGLGERLNATDGQGAAERWKRTCQLVALTPRTE